MFGIAYYWFVFTGLLALTITQLVAVLEIVPVESYGTENPIMFTLAILLFLFTAIAVLLVFWEHKDRFGWLLAIAWFVIAGIPVLGPSSYLAYWLSRINGLKE